MSYFLSTPCGGRTHTLSFKYRILSPARLPVPPREHNKITIIIQYSYSKNNVCKQSKTKGDFQFQLQHR